MQGAAVNVGMCRTVKPITDQRTAERRHVHADLMCAPGFQLQPKQAVTVLLLQRLVMCDCRLPVR